MSQSAWSCSRSTAFGPGDGRVSNVPIWRIVAMVIGFMIFWPLGLAILVYNIWGPGGWAGRAGHGHRGGAFRAGGFGDGLYRNSGNSAFEDYKRATLERLEEERRQLAEEQRAFGEFLAELKRAKDREEFDRFMRERQQRRQKPAEDGGEPSI